MKKANDKINRTIVFKEKDHKKREKKYKKVSV